MTNIFVPPDVSTILSFGPRFAPSKMISLGEYISRLYVIQNLGDRLQKDPVYFLRGYLTSSYDHMLRIISAEPTSIEKKLTLMLDKARQFLRTHENICIVQSDKGKSLILITKDGYYIKMEELINKGIKKGAYKELTDIDEINAHIDNWHTKYIDLYKRLIREWVIANRDKKPYHFPLILKGCYLHLRSPIWHYAICMGV